MTEPRYVFDRPWLVPEIEEAIYGPERIVMIEGATKTGKTTTCMIWLAEQAMEHGKVGRNFWWVGSIYRTAEIAYRRLKNGLPKHLYTANDSKLTLTLPNGAILGFRSAENPDNLFGEDVYAAVGDEVTRWREASYFALRSTITATGGPLRLLYNTKGSGNWAYKLSQRISQGSLPSARHAVFDTYVAVRAGLIPETEVEAARAELPEQVFNELYLCIPTDDGGNPFGLKAIRAQIADLSTARPVVWGWDLAKSVDWTVGIALDASGDVCALERWQAPWEDTIRRIVAHTGATPALVDSTGVGDPILERVQTESPGIFEGFKFTSASKQQLMEGLAAAIGQRQIRYPDGPIVSELETFEFEYRRVGVRYSAPEGLHDDCVMALALAVQHWTVHRRDTLPYAYLRNDAEFRASVLPQEETEEERQARRLADYLAAHEH